MLRVPTSAHLDDLPGQRRARPAATPTPAAPAPAAPATVPLEQFERALVQLADQQRQTSQAVASLANKPRQLEADIVRDASGRMTKIIIQITQRA